MPEQKPSGRPLKLDSVEELEARINAYFADCDRRRGSCGNTWEMEDIYLYTVLRNLMPEMMRRTQRCRRCWGPQVDRWEKL